MDSFQDACIVFSYLMIDHILVFLRRELMYGGVLELFLGKR